MASLVERNGKYSVVINYTDPTGKRRQKWETFETKKEAKEYKKKVEQAQSVGLPVVIPAATTVEELMREFVDNYGREKWSYSNYDGNIRMIRNYILPYIGKMKIKDISPRWIENYYHTLLQQERARRPGDKSEEKKYVTPSTVKEVHRLLRCAFGQAERWEIISSNPFEKVTTPRHKQKVRDIWELDDMKKALAACDDPILELCINLAFSCSLRLGEILGLTWDCVHISDELIDNNSAWIYVEKQLQRISEAAYKALSNETVFLAFPTTANRVNTRLILKEPKTASSVRKIFLPKTVALLLRERKETIEAFKNYLGDEYQDYDLVICHDNGTPMEGDKIRKMFNELIQKTGLKPVVFHSLRHSSTTYKLKLSGGDIKAVQGDTGHAEAAMITERYAHILDDDRRINAEKFEEMFYQEKDNGLLNNTDELLKVMKKLQESPELLELIKGLVK